MYRESSRLSSSRLARLSSRLRIAGADRVNRSCPSAPSPPRVASMLAIGASRIGGGSAASRVRDCWNVSAQRTSGVSRTTWRRFHPIPSNSTKAISAFSNGLVENATISAEDRNTVSTATAARKISIRIR